MAKRRPLATQHLENSSREALERYLHILRAYIRNRQEIYALFRRGKLYYIGLAGNLRARLKAHLEDHRSLSVAGVAVVDGAASNGWTFWTCERSPGDWVPREELRRR